MYKTELDWVSAYKKLEQENADLKAKNKWYSEQICNKECKEVWGQVEELQKENAELIQENEEMKNGLGCETCQIHLEYMSLNNRIADLEKENAELKEKYEKLLSFATERTECCDVCSQSDICVNEEGTCPYAGILKGKGNEEKVTREWIEQFLNSEVNNALS